MKSFSVVIPIYNEEENLPLLLSRLIPVLDSTGRRFEILFVDDGSRDGSLPLLKAFAREQAGRVRVLELARNFGQHPAILAAFQQSRGDVVVTLDADLQNPPEEIPKLLAKMDEGYDVVGGIRRNRHDSFFRRIASRMVNRVTGAITGMKLSDYGCMLRAYSREVVEEINSCEENATFIPALAQSFSRRPTEVEVAHAERAAGASKYSLYRLVRLNFDLMTGFSVVPLQIFTLFGFFVAAGGVAFGIFLGIRRLIVGAEVEGVFTLFAILFTVVGILLAGLGIVGEYIGRIYQEVRRRPRFSIRGIHGESGLGRVSEARRVSGPKERSA
ncbi:MAG: glycosyltransferase [Thermoanaerobaculia bacterium]